MTSFPFLQLLCFLSDWYKKQNTKYLLRLIENDVTMTSSLILRTRFVKSTSQRMCCHGNMKHCILVNFCSEVLTIISKHSSKFCEDWFRKSVTVTSLLSWRTDFASVLIQKCVSMGILTARFYPNLPQRHNIVFLTKIQIFVKIDIDMTSQWCHYYFGGLDLLEAPLQESVAMATTKDLHSNFYLLANSYIFSGKFTKFGWIIFLPLWVIGKKPQGWYRTPPPPSRIGLKLKILLRITLVLSILWRKSVQHSSVWLANKTVKL